MQSAATKRRSIQMSWAHPQSTLVPRKTIVGKTFVFPEHSHNDNDKSYQDRAEYCPQTDCDKSQMSSTTGNSATLILFSLGPSYGWTDSIYTCSQIVLNKYGFSYFSQVIQHILNLGKIRNGPTVASFDLLKRLIFFYLKSDF